MTTIQGFNFLGDCFSKGRRARHGRVLVQAFFHRLRHLIDQVGVAFKIWKALA